MNPTRRAVASWLYLCTALVFIMVMIGGVTRLTDSGLSIVEWRPVTGTLPPLSAEEWQVEFDKYRASPQYQKVNTGMSMEEFKAIYWPEYLHRLKGRIIGIVFLVPFVWFLWRGVLSRGFAFRLGGIFALGGLQGAMGWYMVQSGLVDEPAVSQYRLAAHLLLALLIFALLLWSAMDVARDRQAPPAPPRLRKWLVGALACAGVTIFAGALVAGLDAGLTYNTFPLMDGRLIPPGLYSHDPLWLDPFENRTTVQFHHRILGIATFCVVWIVALQGLRAGHRTGLFLTLGLAVTLQASLGIVTLLLVVPVTWATAHQAGAVLLLGLLLAALHRPGAAVLRPPSALSPRLTPVGAG